MTDIPPSEPQTVPARPAPDAPLALSLADVDALDIVITMRFAFFGRSGWKSADSREKTLLFGDRRLAMRLQLLRNVALASLAAQDDQNFHLYILTSADLPEEARAALQSHCTATLRPDQVTIDARPPAPARKHLRNFMQGRYGRAPMMQVVLDDDDGLASSYISRLRSDMRAYLPDATQTGPGPRFISYSHGYGLAIGENPEATMDLYLHRYPFINLGLDMLTEPGKKNIFAIDHLKAPKTFGCHLVRRVPMWVRSVHFTNDSRVRVTERWTKIEDWTETPEVMDRFAYLVQFKAASV